MKTIRRPRSLGGGYSFRRYAGQPGSSLVDLPVPANVLVPLLQGFGVPLNPMVAVGERVAAGQIIARDDGTVSSPIHATINGKVTAIGTTFSCGRQTPAITISGDLTTSFQRLAGHSSQWQSLAPARIEELLYLSGVTGLAREGIPTRFRSSVIAPADVRHVIIIIPGADAFNVSPAVLLSGTGADRFLTGVDLVGRILPGAKLHVASSAEDREVLRRLARLAPDHVDLHQLDARYPQDATELLVMSVLGSDFPFGYAATNIGVVIADAQAMLAATDAVVDGKPVIDRVLALAGPGLGQPTHVRVRVGAPVEQVLSGRLKDTPLRIIRDSLIAGTEVKDLSAPVTRADSLLITALTGAEREPFAFAAPGLHVESWSRSFLSKLLPLGIVAETNRHGELRPCIGCGWCAEACPVRIMPHLVSRSLRFGIGEPLLRLGVFNCIDCNLCSVICPSKIPLARQMRETKEKLQSSGCDNSSCVLPRFDLRGVDEYKGVRSVR